MAQPPYTKEVLDPRHRVGSYTYGTPRVLWWGEEAVLTIGRFCSIADEVTILLGGEHPMDRASTYPFRGFREEWPGADRFGGRSLTKGDVHIGNDVWIGLGATILSGVTVGDGAVIGARAVVTKDVEPYAVVAGNPAAEVRRRFDAATVERLRAMRWWDWEPERIRANLGLLCGPVAGLVESEL